MDREAAVGGESHRERRKREEVTDAPAALDLNLQRAELHKTKMRT